MSSRRFGLCWGLAGRLLLKAAGKRGSVAYHEDPTFINFNVGGVVILAVRQDVLLDAHISSPLCRRFYFGPGRAGFSPGLGQQ